MKFLIYKDSIINYLILLEKYKILQYIHISNYLFMFLLTNFER